MDTLFAAHLGEKAVVQVHDCSDEAKGKGVFALVDLSPGDTALSDVPMAFLPSAELTAAAVAKKSDVAPKVHDTCANCGCVTFTSAGKDVTECPAAASRDEGEGRFRSRLRTTAARSRSS